MSTTPEHAEEVHLAQQSDEMNKWTVQQLEEAITKAEKDACFNIRGNSLAADKAWTFVLFPENQERDADRYPKNYESDQIRIRRDRYINMARVLLARIGSLKANKKPSTDINGDEFALEFRVRRLIEDRKDMFKQYQMWERRYGRINLPTLVIDNADVSLGDDEKMSPYQKLLIFLLDEAYELGYRRYKDQCCVQIKNTRAWRTVKEIKTFVWSTTQKEDNSDMWKNLTSRASCANDCAKHLTSCTDYQFPEIKKDRHTWSFSNGLLRGKIMDEVTGKYKIEFNEYTSKEFREIDPTLVSSKYFDLPFDPHTECEEWYDIPTPSMQKVMDYQRFDKDVCKWLYVFIGRLCYNINEIDGWQVIPFLKGIALSGKSTLITKVCKKFYDCEDISILSNNIEKKFGLSSIYNGFMFVSPEIKGDLQLEQAEFQSMVSGEDVSVARKNETALSLQWKTPGILGGNEVPNWKDNSGSVLRRLATWNFGRRISEEDADPLLEFKLEKELPAIMCKCLRAYLDYAGKYSDKDIWRVLPAYFKVIQSQVASVTNSLQHFLSSEKFKFSPDLMVPQKIFIAQFNQHCRENNLGTHRFNEDFYCGPFSSKDISVKVDSLNYRGAAFSTQPFIFGLDFSEADMY